MNHVNRCKIVDKFFDKIPNYLLYYLLTFKTALTETNSFYLEPVWLYLTSFHVPFNGCITQSCTWVNMDSWMFKYTVHLVFLIVKLDEGSKTNIIELKSLSSIYNPFC